MWETFTGGSVRGTATVTFTNRGLVLLSSSLSRMLFAEERYAELMFDRERSRMAIRLLIKGGPGIYPIRKQEYGLQITGTAFFKHYGIFPKETVKFQASIGEGRRIEVDVSELVQEEELAHQSA